MFRLLNELLAPEDSGSGSSDTDKLSANDILKFLDSSDDDDEAINLEEGKKDGTRLSKEDSEQERSSKTGKMGSEKDGDESGEGDSEGESDGDDDELSEIEEELKEVDEDKLELVTPVRRKEILKEFPELFKKFPYLEKAYYREQQFTELFPTINDAKEANEKATALDSFESDLMNGNTETVLRSLKQQDPNAFNKVVDNYLSTLNNVDEKAYNAVLGNIVKGVITAMSTEAGDSDNDVLKAAAHVLNQFVFGTSKFEQPVKLAQSNSKNEETEKLNRERKEFVQQRFESARDDLAVRIDNSLKSTIDTYIDPKGSMTDYIKRNASRSAIESLQDVMSKDVRFKTVLNKLWEHSASQNFSKESVEKVRSAYLSRAKTLLPAVIKSARNEALKGLGKRNSSDEDVEKPARKGPVSVGKSTTSSASGGKNTRDAAKAIPPNMKSYDYLMQD